MRCRRAVGALLTIFILAPLPALCTVCATDPCPTRTAAVSGHGAGVVDAPRGHCHEAQAEPAADLSIDALAPDCCVSAPDATAATPAVPAPAPLAFAPLAAQIAIPSLTPAFSAEARGHYAPPPELREPLYTLYSSLLI